MPERPPAGRWALLLGAVAIVAGLPVDWPTPITVAALALTLGFTPGWLVARRLAPRAGTAGRALFALATAPFLTGAPAALLFALGVAPLVVARVILAAVALAALLSPAPRAAAGEEGAPSGVPWLAAASWTALIAALLFGNPWLVPRSDGWFHAAVTLQIAERGAPPEDPFFAGLRLLYFWGYHAWAAVWMAAAPRLSVWAPLVAFNLAGTVAVMLGVCALARRLGAGTRGMAVAAAVAALGCGPFSWMWILLRAFTGDVRGLPELERLISLGTGPALQTLSAWTLHASMIFFGDKFLVLTPFSLGLAQFTLLVLVLLDFLERPGWRTGVALGLVEASALFVHSVVGWSGAMLAGVWWWWALWRSRRPDQRHLRGVLLPLIAVFAAVVLVLLPYLLVTTVGKHDPVTPADPTRAFLTWVLPGLLVVPAGMTWLWRERRRVPGARDLLLFASLLTVAGLTLSMPGNNQTKFFNLMLLMLSAPAAMGLVALHQRLRGLWRPALVVALLVAVVPTMAVAVWAFATERGQFAAAWEHARPGEVEGMRWARDHTAADAIVVDSLLFLDAAVRAHRSVISGGPAWERNWGYDAGALDLRRRAARELGSLGVPSDPVAAFMTGLGRPAIVTRRRRGDGWTPERWRAEVTAPHPGYALLYHNDDIALFRWSPVR